MPEDMPLHHSVARREAWEAVEGVFERYKKLAEVRREKGLAELYDADCMRRAEIIDAGPEGTVSFKFHITPMYSNMNNVAHGGAYGVLFDMFTTTALAPVSRPGYWDFMGGITRALNITYLRGIPADTTVIFRSKVVQHGKTAALIHGEVLSMDGKKIYATAEHHKINVPMLAEHKAARVKWDDTMDRKVKAGEVPGSKL